MNDSPRPARTLSRRTVVRGAAWSVPAISVVAAAPAFAQSSLGTMRFTYTGDVAGAAAHEGLDSTDDVRTGARYGLLLEGGEISVDDVGAATPGAVTLTVTFQSSSESGYPTDMVGVVDAVPAGWSVVTGHALKGVPAGVGDPDLPMAPPPLLGMYESLVLRSDRALAEGENGELPLNGWLASTDFEDRGTFLLTFRADGFADLHVSFETPRPDFEG